MNPPEIERFALRSRFTVSDLHAEAASSPARDVTIAGIAAMGHGIGGDLCFCDREPRLPSPALAHGTIILTTRALEPTLTERFPGAVLVVLADPRAVFLDALSRWLDDGHIEVSSLMEGPLAVHASARIGSHTVLHPEVRIDENVRIGSNCVIGRGTWLQKGAVVRDGAVIGTEGINAYVGADGIQRGFSHLGSTIVGARVEIGANAVLARGILRSTVIGDDTIIGNLSNIGHGTRLGRKVWMSVGCMIGGHTTFGDMATCGMSVTVRDNISVGERAQIGMGSVVVKSVPPEASMMGLPARPSPPLSAGPSR
ncbi:MAG: DapH/DapD/GlmU-related protein [Burkholderiaceae bacterium]